jgi:hypothetical protein
MDDARLASWLIEHEARALLTRLDRLLPFALQDTMLPAAAIPPRAATAIEGYLADRRRQLRSQTLEFIGWVREAGQGSDPAQMQHRFTLLRLRFNVVLAQLELFAEALSQRSEAETGVWLSGLDLAAQDALRLREDYYLAPPVICYLHRELGGAIRRAHTRLPGGGGNPVSIIRIPRERMIGYGIASSLVHETGHQAAALLGLVASLRTALRVEAARAPAGQRPGWRLLERWISEIIADFWSVAKVGVASTLGLMGIVSLPRAFVFRMSADDPHPFPWFRVKLSCAIGEALYPDPQWRQLGTLWDHLYPAAGLSTRQVQIIELLEHVTEPFVAFLTGHRPVALRGNSLGEAVSIPSRTPQRLGGLYERWRASPWLMRDAAPTLVFAVLGQARATGRLSPEREDRMLGELITWWAVQTTPNGADLGRHARALTAGHRTAELIDVRSGEQSWK